MPSATPEIDLSNRPMVGQVDLDFAPQAATRMAQGNDAFNQVVWQNGDKIGARIIDAPNGGGYKDHSLNYSAVEGYASSNYEYAKGQEDGIWRTEALLVEGHYMFYAPYNPSQGREALVFNFPCDQTINKIEDGKVNEEAVANFFGNLKNQTVLVGHAFIDATEHTTKVSPFMEHLYAYPQFTFEAAKDFYAVNEDLDTDTIAKGKMEISKIIINDTQIKNKYQVSHSRLIQMMQDAVAEEKNDHDGYTNYAGHEAGRWQSALNLLRDGKTSDILRDAYSDGAVKKVVISLENAYTAEAEEEFKFHAVLPAFAYDNLKVNVVFKDSKGVEWTFVNDIQLASDITLAPGKRYPREEYDFSEDYDKGYATKASAGTLISYVIPSGQVKKYVPEADPVYIKYASELAEVLAKVDNNTKTVRENVDFTLEKYKDLTGDNEWKNGKPMLQFNDSVINVVNQYLDKGKVEFESQMIVSEDLTPAMDRFAFKGGVYQTAGTLTLDAKTLENVTLGESTFKGTVTLKGITTDKNMDFKGNATVNGGTYGNLTFAAGKTAKIQGEVSAKNVTLNNGAAEIGKLDADATVINGGTVTVPANFEGDLGTITAKNATLNIAKAITNDITLGNEGTGDNVGNYYNKVTLNISAENFDLAKVKAYYADINLNNNSKMSQVFVSNWKSGAITNAKDKTLTLTDVVTIPAKSETGKNVNRTFTNNGKVTGTLKIAAGAEVTNNYELTVAENNGKIITGTDSRTYVTSGTGEVDNSSLSYVKNDAAQTVYAIFEDSKTVAEIEAAGPGMRYINKLVFEEGLSLEKEFSSELLNNVKSIEIQGGDVVVKAFVASSINKLDITGNVTFRGTLDRDNAGFGFKNGADITITEGNSMTVAYMSMGTLNNAKGLNINGNVIVKDANLYIGLGSAVNYELQLDGKILNAYYDTTIKQPVSQKTKAFYAALAKGGKVVVFEDMAISPVTITQDTEIDLNNKTIKAQDGNAITITEGKSLTIGGGTVYTEAAGKNVILNKGGNLTINSGTYEVKASGEYAAVVCDYANGKAGWNLTINGGTFTSKEHTAVALQNNRRELPAITADGLATINGGTFNGEKSTHYDLYLGFVKANINFEACTFSNSRVWVNVSAPVNASIINTKEVTDNGLLTIADWTE